MSKHRLLGVTALLGVAHCEVASVDAHGAVHDSSWPVAALQERLAKLTEENVRLHADNVRLHEHELEMQKELAAQRAAAGGGCLGWRQTGGCDPEGGREPAYDLPCGAIVNAGSSGYCECLGGSRVGFTCSHEPISCDSACSRESAFEELAAASSEQALRSASLKLAAATPPPPSASPPADGCGGLLDCRSCAAQDGCGWCLAQRQCVEDEPWICSGDHDHVSEPDGRPPPGRPGKARCPTPEEAARAREAREAREASASASAPAALPRAAVDAVREESVREARERQRQQAQAQEAELRSEMGEMGEGGEAGEGGEGGEAGEADEADEAAAVRDGRVAELRRRVAMAEEEEGGARPYDVLEIDEGATQAEVRRAYRRLSLLLHPDKNRGDEELARRAFADVVAAYEVLGTPDKRQAFDEARNGAGGEGFAHFEARWQQKQYAFDSDLYAGARFVTTLTERVWEKRLVGETAWLVEVYAAWCPACRAFVNEWQATGALMRDDDVEVGAINCEKNRDLCADWLAVSAYPSIVLLNRQHGTVQLYPEGGDRTPDAIRSWALAIAAEWRYLFAASNVTSLDAGSFDATVLRSERAWLVMFSDGLVCSQCRTAKTNLMRLSASLRGMPVGVGLVDCEQPANRELCYETHALPPSPHRPQLKMWRSGDKRPDDDGAPSAKGELLYNPNQLESHVALQIAERAMRLALHDRLPTDEADSFDNAAADPLHAAGGGFQEEREAPRAPDGAPTRPSTFQWDGPQMRHKPLPWGGPTRPDRAMLRG